MTRFLRLAIVWALIIAALCLTPGKAIPSWEWADLLSVDKMVHMLLFGVLSYLCARGLRDRSVNTWSDGRILFIAGLLSFAYGALMEVLQGIPGLGRHGDLVDLTANTIGALVGALLVKRLWVKKAAAA
ncbi:MAG: VanZ family protein [Flavobacteriales bacterium]|nr:VanZ family protein [Flavobacteriales bacterium]